MNLLFTEFSTFQFQSIFNAPPSIYSSFECISTYFAKIGPFHQRFRFAIIFYKMVSSGIAGLFSFRCPSTIFRTIITIIIDSVYRVSIGRFFTNVFDKVINGIKPTVTNFYPPTSIMLKLFCFFIITPPYHHVPRSIFGRCCKVVIAPVTSAGFYPTIFEMSSIDDCDVSTNTAALPMPVFFNNSYMIYNRKIVESFSDQIIKFSALPTGFIMAAIKTIGAYYRNISAFAFTLPMSFSIFCGMITNYGKLSVNFSNKIGPIVSFFRHNILQAGSSALEMLWQAGALGIQPGSYPLPQRVYNSTNLLVRAC